MNVPADTTIDMLDVSFALQHGQRLMISGPSGAGKTTLTRALAGLWSGGDGQLKVCESTVFLPQEPYIPEGSLRRVLTFPHAVRSDAAIRAAAQRAHLEDVLGRFEQRLDAEADWETVLSRGEKQRCAFCRLLLLSPKVVILDEATSALDEATEGQLYEELLQMHSTPTVITISHRPALSRFHTHVLRYVKCPENGVTKVEEFQDPASSPNSADKGGMPPIDDEDDFADVNVTAAVDKLLAMPFEAALKECKELRAYVHSSERSKVEIQELEAEIKDSWSSDAPTELRDLLEELLFPEIAKRRAAHAGPLSRL
ncbi:Hydrophilic compounds import ATP-binding/permease protein BacA (Hydrophilic compounds ABC transporter BacA) [Durusdinium trenchii]|uniref:Hydrophilic compounds import ATP-binding/permease protein BacA (Hydrophilic compounds ABC transporter BacA) n=1 Tax=Durusdinium trenchii TaxID=1381693 RepID=A0ABP0LRB7_9DINO